MLQLLYNQDVWQELKTLSRKRGHRLRIAVLYIGRGDGRLLQLKRGDELVVAMIDHLGQSVELPT